MRAVRPHAGKAIGLARDFPHEIGHHAQNLLGLLPEAQQAQPGMGKAEANSLQVRVELRAATAQRVVDYKDHDGGHDCDNHAVDVQSCNA
jgi:hypothetical protein